MSDIGDKILTGVGVATMGAALFVVFFLVAFLLSMATHIPQERACVRNGGEPYYFMDLSFECRNNVNVSVATHE